MRKKDEGYWNEYETKASSLTGRLKIIPLTFQMRRRDKI